MAPMPMHPSNMSSEQAREFYNVGLRTSLPRTKPQKFKQMKARGVPETDPEFIKTRNVVMAIQRHVEAAKQSHLQAKPNGARREFESFEAPY